MSARRFMQGYTLAELLIVVVIMSILTAIAVPSYSRYVMRTHRAVAKTALQELATRQESYAVDHKRYSNSLARLGLAVNDAQPVFVNTQGAFTNVAADAIYTVMLYGNTGTGMATCAITGSGAVTATAFRILATPSGSRTQDTVCGALCVSSVGERGAAGGAADCWQR